jgi:hypothetical protein
MTGLDDRSRIAASVATAGVIVLAIGALTVPLLVHSSGRGHGRAHDRQLRSSSIVPMPPPNPRAGGQRTLLHLTRQRVSQLISIDGGQLQIAPPPADVTPAVSAASATRIAARAAASADAGWRPTAGPSYGLVTISPALTKSSPAYLRRAAWITVLRPSGVFACPAAPSTVPAGSVKAIRVVLTDASTGAATVVYTSPGLGICNEPVTGPSVVPATRHRSV